MEKCSYCSRENPDEAIYCQFCGQKLNAEPIQVIPTTEYKATAKRKVRLIFGCCIILLFIGIGFTIYGFFDEGPDTSTHLENRHQIHRLRRTPSYISMSLISCG